MAKKVIITEPETFASEELAKLQALGFAIIFKKPGGAYAVVDAGRPTTPSPRAR